jgi:peptidoglycan hydrolase-like protein with peptidoglycan-binding domain
MNRLLATVAIAALAAGTAGALAQTSPQTSPPLAAPSPPSSPAATSPADSGTTLQSGTSGRSTSGAATSTRRTGASGAGSAASATDSSSAKQAQTELKAEGLYTGPIDGKVGGKTKQAIAAYQKKQGLPATGRLDQPTLASLKSHGGAASGSSSSSGAAPSASGGAILNSPIPGQGAAPRPATPTAPKP